jgi:hypothetical protein
MRTLIVGGQQRARSVIPGADLGGTGRTHVRGDHDCG